jgi:hypothetical protein
VSARAAKRSGQAGCAAPPPGRRGAGTRVRAL